jgi:23S rRNA (adenine2030-N6)-methyltransferase
MNYRHHFHAGNFADVVKHVLFVQLFRALQMKEKGFVYLDTHAGRGAYDLTQASSGDSRERRPEWPDGIGRLWSASSLAVQVEEYVTLVRRFDRERGNAEESPRNYPGSPALARMLAREEERLIFCEKHPEEFRSLADEFRYSPGVIVQETDGYQSVRATLPTRQRRALILLDPAYEEKDEFARVRDALREGLARLASGVFAIWYPLTQRVGADAFFADLLSLKLPPTLVVEVSVADENAGLRMRGSGMVIVNPPWKFEQNVQTALESLARILAQAPGGRASVRWLVQER